MGVVELHTALKSTGIPVAYRKFKKAQTPPYITYYFVGTDNFGADNVVYAKNENYVIELYSRDRDLASEIKIENVLDSSEIYWDKDESFIESENLFMMIYEIQI